MHLDLERNAAKQVAQDVRNYVRDRFTPGSLESLNQLEDHVTEMVTDTLRQMRSDWRHG